MRAFRIGTRGSPLALVQAHAVAALLHERAGVESTIVVITTQGDRAADTRPSQALAADGGKRLFVKEIQDALLAGSVDLAVHSSKDMPATPPAGLALAAALPREDPRDAIVLPQDVAPGETLDGVLGALGPSPRIGTSSVRRASQLRTLLPGATFAAVRGNLDTRLRKLDQGEYDALVLAAAGLRRLACASRISATLTVEACVPAPGQGIIAVETRADDPLVQAAVARIGDRVAEAALRAEQAVVRRLGGGCQMPVGAYAEVSGDALVVTGVVLSVDGERVIRAVARGTLANADAVGSAVGTDLIDRGAAEILVEVQRAHEAIESRER